MLWRDKAFCGAKMVDIERHLSVECGNAIMDGIPSDILEAISTEDREELLVLIACIMEDSFRRGFDHGARAFDENELSSCLADGKALTVWRYCQRPHVSLGHDGSRMHSLERLKKCYPFLEEIGFSFEFCEINTEGEDAEEDDKS